MTSSIPSKVITEHLNKLKDELTEYDVTSEQVDEIISGVSSYINKYFSKKGINISTEEKKTAKKQDKKKNDDLPEFEDLMEYKIQTELDKFNVDYLKGALAFYSLKKNGKKGELIKRLWLHISTDDFIEFFTKNDNSRIKKEELKNYFGEGLKYKKFHLHEYYYGKVHPKIKKKLKNSSTEEYIGYNTESKEFISVWSTKTGTTKKFYKFIINITNDKKIKVKISDQEESIYETDDDENGFYNEVYNIVIDKNICHINS